MSQLNGIEGKGSEELEGLELLEFENMYGIDIAEMKFDEIEEITSNFIFLSQNDIDNIKSRLGTEPWKAAYNKLKTESDVAYNRTYIPSVIDGAEPAGWDPHKLYSPSPTAGIPRTDYSNAITIRNSVRALGLRYALSNESDKDKYAKKAIEYVKKWCLDNSTWMYPQYTGGNSYIDIMITMPGMLYGAYLTWNYSGWDKTSVIYGGTNTNLTVRTALKKWSSELLDRSKSIATGDAKNYRIWRQVTVCVCAVVSNRNGEIAYQINDWKTYFPNLVDINGSIKFERGRQGSACPGCQTGCCGLSYSGSGIRALITVAELARHQGIDLYHWKMADGRSLERALDFHAPFYNKSDDWYQHNTTEWPYCTLPNKCFKGQSADIFELAYSFVANKIIYKNAANRWGGSPRYLYDERTLGPVTLTHGTYK